MSAQKVIEPEQTKWATTTVFAKKEKDTILRFCVYFKKQYSLQKEDSYPIPRSNECMDSLGKAALFFTLDAKGGYWPVEFDEIDRDKTASISPLGS